VKNKKAMKITKKLKYATFEWDDEDKTFTITEEDGNRVILNKVYSFAFMRFVVRMAQRNWYRKIPSKTVKATEAVKEEEAVVDPNQEKFSFEETMKDQWDKLPF
jgi:hypothetical protein